MNNYIVYKHTSPSGKVYIGITSQAPNRRWRDGNGYRHNLYFARAIEKYGWDNFKHEILRAGLSKAEAEAFEIELIKKHESTDPKRGYNIDNGGNSTGKRSKTTKKKLSEISKANPSRYWLGKKLTEEHIKHAVENRRKSYGAENPKSKKVVCGGAVFESASQCAKHYGVTISTIMGYCNGLKKVPERWKALGLKYL